MLNLNIYKSLYTIYKYFEGKVMCSLTLIKKLLKRNFWWCIWFLFFEILFLYWQYVGWVCLQIIMLGFTGAVVIVFFYYCYSERLIYLQTGWIIKFCASCDQEKEICKSDLIGNVLLKNSKRRVFLQAQDMLHIIEVCFNLMLISIL